MRTARLDLIEARKGIRWVSFEVRTSSIRHSELSDPELLESMRVADRAPQLAIVVKVTEAFMHCAKAFRRSQLWNPDHFQDRVAMPSLSKIILDQTTGAPSNEDEMRKIDDDLEEEYQKTLY